MDVESSVEARFRVCNAFPASRMNTKRDIGLLTLSPLSLRVVGQGSLFMSLQIFEGLTSDPSRTCELREKDILDI